MLVLLPPAGQARLIDRAARLARYASLSVLSIARFVASR
jgi:hypothetical protein